MEPDPWLNRTFGGYRVDERIGEGGMASVYRGTQLSLGRPVAIKVLPELYVAEFQFRERFRREADALGRLQHKNIVTVIDRGEVDERPFLVMEYVDGKSLRDILREGRLPVRTALNYIHGVLSALDHAHALGVVHRDVKPENVLVGKDGTVKVVDFGLGRYRTEYEMTRLTHTRMALGTREYMSPEQREKAKDADERSDLYSAGVILYEMLTGELPIGRFESPSAKRPGECDRRIDVIVELALQNNPDDRYQRAAQMAHAVKEALRSSG